MNHEERAKSLMQHYFRLTAESAGVKWDHEMIGEVGDLVEHLIAAAQPDPVPPPPDPLARIADALETIAQQGEWIGIGGHWMRKGAIKMVRIGELGVYFYADSEMLLVASDKDAFEALVAVGIETEDQE